MSEVQARTKRDSLLLQHFPVALDLIRSGFDKNATWVSALHSGNLGDIIYGLPTCYLLGVNHIVLNVCVDPAFGGRVLTTAGAVALAPLLLEQHGIGRVTVIQSNVPWEYASPEILGVNFVLDSFRGAASIPDLHLAYQHATPFGLHVDITNKWLTVGDCDIDLPREPYLAVNLTPRYRKYGREYYEELFKGIPPENIVFIGVEAEQAQRYGIQGSSYATNDFLKLASLISRAKFFIGNASFPYAVAEGLKVPRLVEVVNGANVYPVGDGGFPLHAFEVGSLRLRLWEALGIKNQNPVTRSIPGGIVGSRERGAPLEANKQSAETFHDSAAPPTPEGMVAALNERISDQETTISELRTRLQVATQHVASVNVSIHERTFLLSRKTDELESVRRDLRDMTQRWAQYDQELHAVRSSRLWRWSQRYRRLRMLRSRVSSVLSKCIRRSAYWLPRYLYWALRGRLRQQVKIRADMKLVQQSGIFDPAYYLRKNRDVAALGIDPLEHFMRCGYRENRNPHPLFKVDYYKRLYLANSEDGENPLVHFLRLGALYQNNPHPLFDTRFYFERNPDVRHSGENPLAHFLRYGVKERRDPSPFFSVSFYLDTYRDVSTSELNPLTHFLEVGFREGRSPNPSFDIRDFCRQHPQLLTSNTNPLEAFVEARDLAQGSPSQGAKVEVDSPRIYRSGLGRDGASAPSGEIVPYVAHFFPAAPRAGNELRMYNLVRWLRGQNYRPLVIVAPLHDEEFSDTQLQQLEELSPDFVIVYRDGRVIASESGGSILGLDDKPIPTYDYGRILGEDEAPMNGSAASIATDRSYCYDALISIVLAACAQINPRLLIVNYVFMTRFFPLLPKKLLKVLDTIDVFSLVAQKVIKFGVRNTASLTSHDEAIRLHRADLIVAIQEEEEAELRKLAPGKRVITTGIDFPVCDTPIPDNRKVLFLASDNPRNVNGLHGFLRYAWPAVMREIPDAQLVIAGRISKVAEKLSLPHSVRVGGEVDLIHDLYAECRLVVNPVVAGTGIKIKTVEALCHFRPLVTWPSGVEGIPARFRELTPVARDWFEFAAVIQDFLRCERASQVSDEMKRDITEYFSTDRTYCDLGDALRDCIVTSVERQETNDDGTERTSAANFQ